jgi:chromosome segregation ATPase
LLASQRAKLARMQEESPSTLLLKKEAEDSLVQDELEITRKKVEDRLADVRAKTVIFERRQAELRETVTKQRQFISDTDAKIEKAQKKAKEETDSMNKKLEEQETYLAQREKLLEEKNQEVKIIAHNSQYKKYLESVVHVYEEEYDGDIEKLLHRHNTLQNGNAELQYHDVEVNKRLDKKREDFQKEVTKLQNEQLVINSALHAEQMELEKLRAEKAELDSKLTSAIDEREFKDSHIGIIQMAIEQLYTRALQSCRDDRRKSAMEDYVVSKFDPKGDHREDLVLEQIEERLKELLWVVDECKNVALKSSDGTQAFVVDEEDISKRVVIIHDDPQMVMDPRDPTKSLTLGTQTSTSGGDRKV